MSILVDKNRRILPPLKFEAWWEVSRAGLVGLVFGSMVILVYMAAFNFISWFNTLLFEDINRGTIVFFATITTLLSFRLLTVGVQSMVDRTFFPDTANFRDEIDQAIRTLTEINTRQDLQEFLTRKLPRQLQVDGIFLHQHSQSLLRYALTLPLSMGNRSMGYLTIGPKQSGRSFSYKERAMLKPLQDQVSLVLSAIQLAEAREEAEKVAQLKSNFVTNISHQLHTPLNTVINSTGLVADGTLGDIDPEPADFRHRAVQGSEFLMNLLEEIVDSAKIESGELTLRLDEVDLSDVLEDALSIVRSTLQHRTIELRVEIADNLPPLTADHTRIRQVLLNLLSNAVKFTKEGLICVKAWENRGTVFISVEDTGIGIAKENISLIFEDYQQVSTEELKDLQFERRRHVGTGLGMPITKALVELHGGRIWVDSEPGQGSVFTFTLPLLESGSEHGNES